MYILRQTVSTTLMLTNWTFIERNEANYYKLVTLVHKLTAFELKMVGFADIYVHTWNVSKVAGEILKECKCIFFWAGIVFLSILKFILPM